MIIFGWGKVTKKRLGTVMSKACNFCNSYSTWDLCIMRTWFTLFFIPIIPYKKQYCISCSNCGSYIPLNKNQFSKIKSDLENCKITKDNIEPKTIDTLKYAGKNETQINFLKAMENMEDKDKNINE